MSAASRRRIEDPFLCSICLHVLTDPVTLPCGHNFCRNCITDHWDVSLSCQCPICKRLYNTRPELHVNTFISAVAARFRRSVQKEASSSSNSSSSRSSSSKSSSSSSSSRSSERQAAKPGEVPCDVCTGTKPKARKSCPVCRASYCGTHLEPHLTEPGLKRHQLIDPVENLEDKVCTEHDKLLELFCKTDQTCICMSCTYSDHKTHDFIPVIEEYEERKAELRETEAEIQQMIQKRQQKIQEIKRSVELSNERADAEIAEGVNVFAALKESVERGQAELIKTIKDKQRHKEKRAEGFIKELQQEISELRKRSSEVEQLSCSEDHLHLLQSFSSLNTAEPTRDWTEVSVHAPSYKGTVRRAVNKLEETLSKQMNELFEAELERVQQYAVDVTLDPDIVHPKPNQSCAKQQVNEGNNCRCVRSKKAFTSGRFYFQVPVKRWSWWTLGVARKSSKKRTITLSPNNGFWTVCLCPDFLQRKYFAGAEPSVGLSLRSCPKNVGVFVDLEEGLVSFYDVDTAALIYSFTDVPLPYKLYPFFSPCQNHGVSLHNIDKRCGVQ